MGGCGRGRTSALVAPARLQVTPPTDPGAAVFDLNYMGRQSFQQAVQLGEFVGGKISEHGVEVAGSLVGRAACSPAALRRERYGARAAVDSGAAGDQAGSGQAFEHADGAGVGQAEYVTQPVDASPVEKLI